MGCLGLQHDVADGSTLLRAGENGGTSAIGRELVEVLVQRAAADDVEHVEAERCKLLEPGEDLTVAQGE